MPRVVGKILIIYASAGEGHRRCAEAIYSYLRDKRPLIEVKLIDVLDYTNFFFRKSYSDGYALLVTKLPVIWKSFYNFTSTPLFQKLFFGFRHFFNKINSGRFIRFLTADKPDLIISTHFLATQIISGLIKRDVLDSYLCSVITDFTVHPFWVLPEVDKYAVASEFTKNELIWQGIKETRVVACGIPLDVKFSRDYQKKAIRQKLGIENNLFTILIAMSGFGYGPIEKMVELLKEDNQLLVACGKNKNLFSRLKANQHRNIKAFKFIDNIEELMAASDIVITKPGGMTITECIAMKLPMIFVKVIPGQEAGNLKVLKRYGVGIFAENLNEIKDKVREYKTNPVQLEKLRKILTRLELKNSAKELIDAVC